MELFVKIVNSFRPATIKKRLHHRCFPMNFEEPLRTSILQSNSRRLLLCVGKYVLKVNNKSAKARPEELFLMSLLLNLNSHLSSGGHEQLFVIFNIVCFHSFVQFPLCTMLDIAYKIIEWKCHLYDMFCYIYFLLFVLILYHHMKKRLQHNCFLLNSAKFLRTPTLKNICVRLPLSI